MTAVEGERRRRITQNTQMGHGVNIFVLINEKKAGKIDRTFYWWKSFCLSPPFYCCPIKLSLQTFSSSVPLVCFATSLNQILSYRFVSISCVTLYVLEERCERQACVYKGIKNDDVSLAVSGCFWESEGWAAISEAEKSVGIESPSVRNLQLDLHFASQRGGKTEANVPSSNMTNKNRWRTFKNLHLSFGNHAWICIYLHFISRPMRRKLCWDDVCSFFPKMFHLRLSWWCCFHFLFLFPPVPSIVGAVDVKLFSSFSRKRNRRNKQRMITFKIL